MLFELQKPDLSNINRNDLYDILIDLKRDDVREFVTKFSKSEYLYWDNIRYKEPSPQDISKEMLWSMIKLVRRQNSIPIAAIEDKKGRFFTWSRLDYFEEFFHNLDMNTGGELFVEKGSVDRANKQKLITRGIMEEAIASSQLEGAATSRQAAKKMLREGRAPVNQSEQMILNSYHSMKAIEEEYKDREMTMDLLLELHGLITKDTLDSEGEKPRLRKAGEPICVTDKSTGAVYHEAPGIDIVKKELQKLIKFANDDLNTGMFIHPIIKAIMLHFWMGYLHPFTDGNGRLARMLFYWYLMKRGYWAFAYLPISKVIKKSPIQYSMAYVYSEQDDNDMTYFIDYNIKKIKVALQEFNEYLIEQSRGNVQMKSKCEKKYNLNMRQIQLLQYLHGDQNERTTLTAHMNVNQVTKVTASKDLKDLAKKGFLTFKKQGKYVYYYPTEKIKEIF